MTQVRKSPIENLRNDKPRRLAGLEDGRKGAHPAASKMAIFGFLVTFIAASRQWRS
ncbi:hypothetical protein HOP60_16410 [Halomonas daqingensis]|uniref:Stress-associated endoplasmic reticulum protein n=1 Tax=Billgrantia desiderata TaxID=52021 RepID=A0ABS9B9C0_9GAMM|nr:hypothetical protein [Halomonas desiderata]MCE8043740.1 hypothetical protein [Halomonas desiderata]MCE8048314.1 hypothetical protein [Halomonas desiderata]